MHHFYIEAQKLASCTEKDWPEELIPSKHLIYSSPATLSFNSPGAEGFGVKRAALTLPNSVMLLFSPGCCGRNTLATGGVDSTYGRRMFYLLLDETDIVTGRYLPRIIEACQTIAKSMPTRPEVIVLCSTCVDALLGTDMERLQAKATEETGIPVLSATMYALTREGHLPPMVSVRKTIYSLLTKTNKRPHAVSLLGFFTHLDDSCELYTLLRSIGIRDIYEIGRMRNMAEYQEMAHSNFTLVLHPEARYAASYLAKKLDIPSIELTRTYEVEKVHKQYMALGSILEKTIDDSAFYEETKNALETVREWLGKRIFALGETSNAQPLALAVALLRMGAHVAEIFTDPQPSPSLRQYIQIIAQLSPKTRIISNLSPTMLNYTPNPGEVDIAIGRDACYYHKEAGQIPFCDEAQPFGYQGILNLLNQIKQC